MVSLILIFASPEPFTLGLSPAIFGRLSSSQGFTRAISQLLLYYLIPISTKDQESKSDELNSIWNYLNLNPDAEKLRRKQDTFFNGYNVELMTIPEGKLWLISHHYSPRLCQIL